MPDMIPFIAPLVLFVVSAIGFVVVMWSIIQTTFKAGIKRGIEIERGEWSNINNVTWGEQGKGKFGGVK